MRLLLLVGIAEAACATPTPQARAQAYLAEGQAFIARGEMASAASALRAALRLQPDLVQARSSLGQAL